MPISIQIQDLTKRFDRITAVDRINLTIKPGEIIGFLGPNGAGKTTTIRMVCGLLKPDEGTILFNGQSLQEVPAGRTLIGLCPQENIHWQRLTCMEQLIFMAQMYDQKLRTARERANRLLAELGIERQAKKQARKLSGGMQRRLNIALALIHDPQILILDEPEAGLDPQSRVRMREFIKGLSGNRTIILTTHNMDEADRLSDRVAIIDEGKILKLGAPLELKSHPEETLEEVFINLTGKALRPE